MNLRALSCGLVAAVVVIAIGCGGDDNANVDAGVVQVASKLIGPAGGTVELEDGGKVVIPEGALSKETRITVSEVENPPPLPGNLEAAGKAYAFKPHGTSFTTAVMISIPTEGDATQVRPLKLDDEEDTSWQTVVGATKGNQKLTLNTTSFSVYQAARPRRNSGVITLPDGATIPIDAASDATIDTSTTDANATDAAPPDARIADAGNDGGPGAAIECDPYTPVDNNNFATYPVVAFTNGPGRYGVMWGISNGGMTTIWDGAQWHPQTFAGADLNPLVIAIDGANNLYADWSAGRAMLPAGANAFGAIDTSRTTAPYGAGHNVGLIGLPTSGAMAVWSETNMQSARATPSAWMSSTLVDVRRRSEPDIAVNANGDIAATWFGASVNAGQADVTLALWNGSTWTLQPDHTVGAAIGGSVFSVRVLMLSNGDPYVLYAQATNGDQSIHGVRYSVSGGTWSADERLIDSANAQYKYVMDSSDRITVVGTDPTTQQVRATRRIGGTWSAAVDLNVGQLATLKLDPNDNPTLIVIPPPQQSPTITRVAANGTTWLAPSPTPFPVSNILPNMVDIAFDTTTGDTIVFSGSSINQMQSLQMAACR